jgi:hypothetical protein
MGEGGFFIFLASGIKVLLPGKGDIHCWLIAQYFSFKPIVLNLVQNINGLNRH